MASTEENIVIKVSLTSDRDYADMSAKIQVLFDQ
jgi:hypothetical protein